MRTLFRCGICVAIGMTVSFAIALTIRALLQADGKTSDLILSGVMGFLSPATTLVALDRIYLRPRYNPVVVYGTIAVIGLLTMAVLVLALAMPESLFSTILTNILYSGGMLFIAAYVMFNFPPQDDDGLFQTDT